jgi:hypothetical protein
MINSNNVLTKKKGVNQSDVLLWLMQQHGLAYKDALKYSIDWYNSPEGVILP